MRAGLLLLSAVDCNSVSRNVINILTCYSGIKKERPLQHEYGQPCYVTVASHIYIYLPKTKKFGCVGIYIYIRGDLSISVENKKSLREVCITIITNIYIEENQVDFLDIKLMLLHYFPPT